MPSSIIIKQRHLLTCLTRKKSYASTARKGIKWYRKVAIELLCNTAIINAHFLHQKVTRAKIKIIKFRESKALDLLQIGQQLNNPPVSIDNHGLIEADKRCHCNSCYNKLAKAYGRKNVIQNSKQVALKCKGCKQSYMCMNCFFKENNVKK